MAEEVTKQKKEKRSLVDCTQAFLQKIVTSDSQEIDLNSTSESLGIQIRRLYDIVNVLSGINVVKHVSKNKVKYLPNPNISIDEEQAMRELDAKEKELAELEASIQHEIEEFTNSLDYKYYAYVDKNDLIKLPGTDGHRFYAFKSQPDMTLEAIDDENNEGGMTLKCESQIGGIDIFEVW
ncbi:putative: transcription factor E2F6-like protein [Tritrichomonas foetus]|uniref:Putative: transcription factor E2F6-like protein n=1 Tax=Tritrichomonas foetus TaxID=1144522 RepID=A0A1J4KGQ8_9EUKA|nr:putative: transcription factor E2F6-like protein [Tritrichomonas foetus]|eukprot:OHT10591.1 putative: transcription factor E2F6-like protein [Tritrichomonas foetus]